MKIVGKAHDFFKEEGITMKRTAAIMMTAAMSVSMILGTASLVSAHDLVRVGSLKGPTSMGLVQFMSEEEQAEDPGYSFEMVTAADELTGQMVSGELDVALVPANMASVLYNKTQGGIQVIDVNTLGVLYMVTADSSVTGLADLKGKTVYSTGKGQTPEYVLNYLLGANGLGEGDVTVEYKSEAAEVVSTLVQDETAVGILPQPFATVACQQNEKLQEVCDLTAEWDKTGKGTMVTGVTIVNKEFAQANPETVEEFLDRHENSAEFAAEQPAEAAELIASYGIVEKAPIAQKALPKCNITCLEGDEMKEALSGYLEVLYEQNPESVGGNLPADDFYYAESEDAED